jgi:amidase
VPAWDRIPDRDAEAVRRLRAGGAVVFGKTNVPAMAGDWQTFNPIFGVTNNPWDVSRSTGGSSGGAAAAVASGLTALELGSDIAGSIRLPSAWCGVCGHKPSWGLVPQRGHLPPPPGALSEADLAVMGPIARSVADLELTLDVLIGPAADSAIAWRVDLPPARATTLGQLRVATWLDDPAYPVDREMAAVAAAAVSALEESGANLVDAAPPVSLPEVVGMHMELLYPLMDPASTLTHRQWLAANERRERLRARMDEYFRAVDALLMPVVMVPPIAHDHLEPMADRRLVLVDGTRSYFDLFGWVGLATVAYLPATAVPIGRTASGLPVGIQVVGPHLEDRTTLAVARGIERVLGGFVAPPGV